MDAIDRNCYDLLSGAGLETILMPRKKFIKEHKNLLKVLKSGDPKALKKEAADQKKELDAELKGGAYVKVEASAAGAGWRVVNTSTGEEYGVRDTEKQAKKLARQIAAQTKLKLYTERRGKRDDDPEVQAKRVAYAGMEGRGLEVVSSGSGSGWAVIDADTRTVLGRFATKAEAQKALDDYTREVLRDRVMYRLALPVDPQTPADRPAINNPVPRVRMEEAAKSLRKELGPAHPMDKYLADFVVAQELKPKAAKKTGKGIKEDKRYINSKTPYTLAKEMTGAMLKGFHKNPAVPPSMKTKLSAAIEMKGGGKYDDYVFKHVKTDDGPAAHLRNAANGLAFLEMLYEDGEDVEGEEAKTAFEEILERLIKGKVLDDENPISKQWEHLLGTQEAGGEDYASALTKLSEMLVAKATKLEGKGIKGGMDREMDIHPAPRNHEDITTILEELRDEIEGDMGGEELGDILAERLTAHQRDIINAHLDALEDEGGDDYEWRDHLDELIDFLHQREEDNDGNATEGEDAVEVDGGLKGVSKQSGFVQRMMAEVKKKHDGEPYGDKPRLPAYKKPTAPLHPGSTMKKPVPFNFKKLAAARQGGENDDEKYGASPFIVEHFGSGYSGGAKEDDVQKELRKRLLAAKKASKNVVRAAPPARAPSPKAEEVARVEIPMVEEEPTFIYKLPSVLTINEDDPEWSKKAKRKYLRAIEEAKTILPDATIYGADAKRTNEIKRLIAREDPAKLRDKVKDWIEKTQKGGYYQDDLMTFMEQLRYNASEAARR